MKTAYFDCVFGVSGDMILGSLAASGVPTDHLRAELGKLGVDGYEIRESAVTAGGISAVHVNVITEPRHEHRHLSHIRDIIESSGLPEQVRRNAVAIFTRLAEAEATVHGATPEKIHFHEVGAVDAIVDVVGACIGLDYLGIEQIMASPIRLGTGTVKCAHGVMPVPVPAVVELTRNVPVERTSIDGEITTPTGAAILTTLVGTWGAVSRFTGERAGYGAGSKEWEDHPNILRLVVGDVPAQYATDHSVLIETNIDDMNPEVYGYLADRMFEAGALDVYLTPIYMKKGRPGTLLSILTGETDMDRIMAILFSETTTLGVRITHVARRKTLRQSRTIDTVFGPVKVKVASVEGAERISPEFDECARIAREHNIPLLKVYELILQGRRN